MLGYEVDFGHMEAMALISSQKFAEKQVGYIVVSVMLNEVKSLTRSRRDAVPLGLVAFNVLGRDGVEPDLEFGCSVETVDSRKT